MIFFLGLDFGTSGARACVLDEAGEIAFESRAAYADPANPQDWREALFALTEGLPAHIRAKLSAIAIDGTSGTLLATDASFEPVGPALLYNDGRATEEAAEIARGFPPLTKGVAQSAGGFATGREIPPAPPLTRGKSKPTCRTPSLASAPDLPLPGRAHNPYGSASGLAKRLWLARHFPDAAFCFHQADWLAALLTGKGGVTDYHNALKSGFDAEKLVWPDWVGRLPGGRWQQEVLAPGDPIAPLAPAPARRLGLDPACIVRAGTTDSIAAFMASGAKEPGEAVTSLGTTLVLKLLSDRRVEDPASGVYSHRYGKLWLAGGASNTGGGVLKQFFSDGELQSLAASIDPSRPSGLDYYPLPRPGERFPVNDPGLVPRMQPRPQHDAAFLHGLLEGMAKIEAMGYRKLAELGASPLKRVLTAGGGAQNTVWRLIRQHALSVPVEAAMHTEAAYGAAMLARCGSGLVPAR